MKKAYIGLCLLLTIALAIFIYLSFHGDALEQHNVKTGSFARVLLDTTSRTHTPAAATKAATADAPDPASVTAGNAARVARPDSSGELDTTRKSILFIGDSMLEGLGPRLAAYAEENGHTLVNVIWYSSTTEVWGRTEKLKGYIDEYHPDYIFVSLGGNELFVSNIRDRRQKYLNHILSQIGNIPFVWIGPPNWKPDTGINEMLAETIGPGRFYLSYTPDQHYDRARDGAHPTRASAAAWMDRVCAWVMKESAHRIVLHRPKAARAHCHTVILAPAK